MRLCPWILDELAVRTKGKTTAICGTNGKTTTNNILYSILTANGKNVICNNAGANMLPGIVTAYIDGCSFFGKIKAEYVCLEIDEATATRAFDSIKPDYMIITNFFRDQLDRYGEIDLTVDWLKRAIDKTPDTMMVLNCDDPLCVGLLENEQQKRCFFSIGEQLDLVLHETKESRFCVFCRHELKYNYYHYSQLGDYYCEHCGFARPKPDFMATNVNLDNYVQFDAIGLHISAKLIGVHNVYNILAAISAASMLGIDLTNINDILAAYSTQAGRMEEFAIQGIPVILNLSKNPAGFNQVITDMLRDPRKKDVVIIIHDNDQDGTDVSWLWDVAFEELCIQGFSRFAASGERAEDVYLRLKYADIDTRNIIFDKNIEAAIKSTLSYRNEVLYVLVNYTPLVETRKALISLGGK